eukprot:jgi/Psemu1/309298/fgenesh1_kg.497_\
MPCWYCSLQYRNWYSITKSKLSSILYSFDNLSKSLGMTQNKFIEQTASHPQWLESVRMQHSVVENKLYDVRTPLNQLLCGN